MSAPTVQWSDDALEAVVVAVARRSPGIVGLQPQVARRAVVVTRDGGSPASVFLRVVTRLEPAPVEILRSFGAEVGAELTGLIGSPVAVEITIVDVRP